MPNTKMLTFYRKDTFSLTAAYDSSVKMPNGFPMKLSDDLSPSTHELGCLS